MHPRSWASPHHCPVALIPRNTRHGHTHCRSSKGLTGRSLPMVRLVAGSLSPWKVGVYSEHLLRALSDGVLKSLDCALPLLTDTRPTAPFLFWAGIPDPLHRGITPRSFEHIFQEVSVRENTKFLIRASYIEIYNEQVCRHSCAQCLRLACSTDGVVNLWD